MKKLLAFLIVPGLLLFGCSKVNENDTNDVIPDEEVSVPEIVAYIDEPELEYTNGTKTTLEGSGSYSIHWVAGDLIKVFNNNSSPSSCVLKASSSGASSKFVKQYSSTVLISENNGPYKAFYPQGIYGYQSGTLNTYGLNVGNWDTRSSAAEVGKVKNYPMMAITESTENYNVLNFKNLMGIVKINLPSVAGITAVEEITVSANEKMSGVGSYQADGDGYVFVPNSSKGSNYKTVSYQSTVDLSSAGLTEYLVVAAGTYHNFKIELKMGGKTATRTAKVDIVVERSKITEITLNSLTFEGLEGSGTQADPFQLSSVADFEYLAAHADGSSYNYYKLMNDITFNSPVTPIGTSSTPFKGYFEGDNHTVTINNGFVTTETYLGLFGYIDSGQVVNLHVEGSDVTIGDGTSNVFKYYGAVVGYADYSTVQNCTNSINLTVPKASGGCYGGVIGSWDDTSSKTLSGCLNTGNITVVNNTSQNPGSFDVGGVCGHIRGSSSKVVTRLYNTGNVEGGFNTGGVVGYTLNELTIDRCYNTGSVYAAMGYTGQSTVNGDQVNGGGIVGCMSAYGNVQNSFNTGNVSVYYARSGGPSKNQGALLNGGGISGLGGNIANCYNTGSVLVRGALNKTVSGTTYSIWAGGICGNTSGTVTNCYNDGIQDAFFACNSSSPARQYTGLICGSATTANITHTYTTQKNTAGGMYNHFNASLGDGGTDCYYADNSYNVQIGTDTFTMYELLDAWAETNSYCRWQSAYPPTILF